MNQPIGSEAGTSGRTAHLTESEYYELLAAKHRRAVLDILATSTHPIELEELAATIATREDVNGVDDGFVDRVRLELHHVHLPKMDSLGVIDYDPAATRIDVF